MRHRSRGQIRGQAGGRAPIAVDFSAGKTPSGWKIHDIRIDGVSLVSTYRNTCNHGIEGLIERLSARNRENARKIAPVQA
jgi:ABC-type transporter MlaC component